MPDTSETSQPVSATRSDAEWRVDRALPRALARVLALDDFEEPARRYLPRPMFGYVSGGAETNASLRANRAQYDEIELSPRVLVDVSGRTAKTALFGRAYGAPFGIAPMGGTSMAAFRGDVVLARAAAAAGVPMIMSGASLTRLEDVRSAGATAWFQAYLPGETGPITQLVERVGRAGFDTLVLTVDVPVSANRENNVRSGFSRPLRPTLRLAWDSLLRPRWLLGMFLRTLLVDGMPHFENMGARIPLITRASRGDGERDRLAWTHLELMRKLWKGRLVLKGVLAPEDARIARESGVDGVIVSNHGGRHDSDDGRRNPPRHRCPEGARARGAVRVRRPALPLRRSDRRGGRGAPRHQAPLRGNRARYGAARHHQAVGDDARADQAAAAGRLTRGVN